MHRDPLANSSTFESEEKHKGKQSVYINGYSIVLAEVCQLSAFALTRVQRDSKRISRNDVSQALLIFQDHNHSLSCE